MKKDNARDLAIEIIRIVACFFVVIMHVETQMFQDGKLIRQALVLGCIVGDAVAVFFAITGCFWFRSRKNYITIILSFLKSIVFPAVCMILILQVFSPYFTSSSFSISFSDLAPPNIKGIAVGILSADAWNFGEVFGAYWYLFEYGFMLFWYPAVRCICRQEKGNIILTGIVIVAFLNCLCTELQWLVPLGFTIPKIPFFPMSLVEMIEGHILYTNRESFKGNRKVRYLCLLLVIGAMALRYFLQKLLFAIDISNNKFLFWDESIALLVIAGVFGFMLSFDFADGYYRLRRILLSVGKLTFYVFLIHAAAIRKIISVGWYWDVYNWCMDTLPLPYVMFDLIMAIIVFLICLPFAWIFKMLVDGTLRCFVYRRKQI